MQATIFPANITDLNFKGASEMVDVSIFSTLRTFRIRNGKYKPHLRSKNDRKSTRSLLLCDTLFKGVGEQGFPQGPFFIEVMLGTFPSLYTFFYSKVGYSMFLSDSLHLNVLCVLNFRSPLSSLKKQLITLFFCRYQFPCIYRLNLFS